MDQIETLLDKLKYDSENPFLKNEDKILIQLNIDALIELQDRRGKDCDCELIPGKNDIIDSGYICIHCGKVYSEYRGPKINIGNQ